MKQILQLSLSGLLMIGSALPTKAQKVKESWSKQIAVGFNWQKVFNSGTYLVNTAASLSKVNADNGEIVWSLKQFGGIGIENVDEVDGTSLLKINHENTIYFIDPFSGKIKFNSKTAGVEEISKQAVLTGSNSIFIGGKDLQKEQILLLVDITTGDVKWKLQEKFGGIISIQEISNTELLLVTVLNNYKLNIADGKVIWKNAISNESEKLNNMKGALGALVKDIANAAGDQADIKITFYKHPSNEFFVIGAENSETRTIGEQQQTIYKNTYSAFKLDNGARMWEKPIELEGKISQFTFYNDNFIVMPNNDKSSTINMFSTFDGVGKWGKKGKGLKIKGGVINYNLGNELIVVSKDGNKNMMTIVDIHTGLPMFKKPIRINGEVVETHKTNQGILYVTTNEVNIINPNNGLLVYPKSLITQPSLCKIKNGKMYVYDVNEQKVSAIDLQNGDIKYLSNTAFGAKGKETFKDLEIRETGVFVSSDQNVALVDYNGNLIFNNYFPAPKESGLKQALLYAQAARAAYIGARAYQVSNAFQEASQGVNNSNGKEVLNQIGDAYGNYGNQAVNFAAQSIQQANARFKASRMGRDFVIILSDQEEGFALLKVSKENGQIMGKVDLGKDKNPKYAVDDVTGQIFIEGNKAMINSYKL